MPYLHRCKSLTPTISYLLLMSFFLIIGITGCSKSDEKTFSGVSADGTEMGYSVMLRYNNESESLYRLKIKPNNPESFMSQLNQKWHNAGKIKLDAYNSMKAYCEMTKDPAACASLESFAKEISSPKASVSYNLIFYNDNSGVIENINLNQSYDLTNKDSFLMNPIEMLNNFKISRANFGEIKKVELKAKL